MMRSHRGFSLVELLLALTIALLLATMLFQLFHQNERVIRDQTLIIEMQQTARVLASQIADEIRMAGQSVPIRASDFDSVPSEAIAAFLSSSSSSRIEFRAGLTNIETTMAAGESRDFTMGFSRNVSVAAASGFSAGKFVYVAGPVAGSLWGWLRAELKAVSGTSLTLTPSNIGGAQASIHFAAPATVSLEEVVSIYLSSGTVRRATASNMTNLSSPVWSAANEIGRNVTALTFTYYDEHGAVVLPSSLSNRMAIARVDIRVTVEAASPLSNGTRPTFSLAMKTIPRNVLLRSRPM